MTVLVTGSGGLVGHLIRSRLDASGVAVLPLDREAVTVDGVEQIACDVTDAGALARAVAGHTISAIVHCGGASGPSVLRDDPRAVVEANVGGTANLLELARRAGVRRFVHCSSIAAYGRPLDDPVPEAAPLRPLDVYGATKAAGEHLVLAYREQYGMTGTSLRISTVFGPRRRTDCLIRTLLLDAAAGRRTEIPEVADAPQQYVHVDDVADAVLATLRAPDPGPAYNVTGGAVHTIAEVIAAVRTVEPGVRATPVPADPDRARTWPARLDIAAAADDLGWTPRRELVEAVADYRDWLARHPA